MSHDAAGEVLYNWRVFPLHLEEPPLAALQQGQAHGAALNAAELRQLRGDLQPGTAEPGPAVGTGEGLQQVQMKSEGGSPQRWAQADTGARKDACIAWPEHGGLRKGPAVYRYAACSCSCSSDFILDCLLLCQ